MRDQQALVVSGTTLGLMAAAAMSETTARFELFDSPTPGFGRAYDELQRRKVRAPWVGTYVSQAAADRAQRRLDRYCRRQDRVLGLVAFQTTAKRRLATLATPRHILENADVRVMPPSAAEPAKAKRSRKKAA